MSSGLAEGNDFRRMRRVWMEQRTGFWSAQVLPESWIHSWIRLPASRFADRVRVVGSMGPLPLS